MNWRKQKYSMDEGLAVAEFQAAALAACALSTVDWDMVEHDAAYARNIGPTDNQESMALLLSDLIKLFKENAP